MLSQLVRGRPAEAGDMLPAGIMAAGGLPRLRAYVEQLERRHAIRHDVNLVWLGALQAQLGRREAAIASLRDACDDHFDGLVFLREDPSFDALRDHEEWPSLLARVFGSTAA